MPANNGKPSIPMEPKLWMKLVILMQVLTLLSKSWGFSVPVRHALVGIRLVLQALRAGILVALAATIISPIELLQSAGSIA
jgi:hypothetical protein